MTEVQAKAVAEYLAYELKMAPRSNPHVKPLEEVVSNPLPEDVGQGIVIVMQTPWRRVRPYAGLAFRADGSSFHTYVEFIILAWRQRLTAPEGFEPRGLGR